MSVHAWKRIEKHARDVKDAEHFIERGFGTVLLCCQYLYTQTVGLAIPKHTLVIGFSCTRGHLLVLDW